MTQVDKLELPRECYRFSHGTTQIASEQVGNNEGQFVLESIDFDSEIKINIKDTEYPYKVFVNPEILWSVNMVKSHFIESIKILTQKQFILGTIYTLFSTKSLNYLLQNFNRQAWKIINPYILKDKHLTKFSQEFQFAVFTFLYEIGIKEEEADKFSSILTHLIEYDNAYRLRVVDILTETSKEQLNLPIKEIKRLIKISQYRDSKTVSDKFVKIAKLLTIGLLIPKYRKAFKRTINSINFDNLKMDASDRYWTAIRTDYKFWGKSNEERMKFIKDNNWKYPKGVVK